VLVCEFGLCLRAGCRYARHGGLGTSVASSNKDVDGELIGDVFLNCFQLRGVASESSPLRAEIPATQ